MTVRVYRSTDVGAPSLGGAGSLINVLDACLVTGYGSQAPAGWTKEYSGTNLAAYKQGALATYNQYYLRVDNTNGDGGVVRGYESMDSIDSGVNPFPSLVQKLISPITLGIWWLHSSTANVPWMVVATERTLYLWNAYAVNATSYTPANQSFFQAFGDFDSMLGVEDKGNCLIVGAAGNSTNQYYATEILQFNDSGPSAAPGFIAKSRDGVIPSVNFFSTADFRLSNSSTYLTNGISTVPAPNLSDYQFYYSDAYIVDYGTLNGVGNRLRGKWKGRVVAYNGRKQTVGTSGSLQLINAGDQLTLPQYPGKTFEVIGSRSYSVSNSYPFLLIEVSDTW